MLFGDWLKERRKAIGWNQANFAAEVGVTRRALEKWETGLSVPGVDRLTVLASALGVPVSEVQTRAQDRAPYRPRAGRLRARVLSESVNRTDQEIAQRLGVSVTSVRGALGYLEGRGAVVARWVQP